MSKKNDKTEDKEELIRFDRFIEDGEGLIIFYPPDKDNQQDSDQEASS